MSYRHRSLSIPLFFKEEKERLSEYFTMPGSEIFRNSFEKGAETRRKRDFILTAVTHSKAAQLLANEIRENFEKSIPLPLDELSLNFLSRYAEKGFQLYLAVSKMCMALHLFASVKKRKKPLDEIWRYLYLSLQHGPLYSKYIKDLRELVFIRNVAVDFHASFKEDVTKISNSEFFPKFEDCSACDYDDILKESYLIHFKEDVNDFPWSFEAPEEDLQAIEIFREAAEELFGLKPINLSPLTSEDVYTWVSDSSTFSELTGKNEINRKLIREIMARGENPYVHSSLPFTFKRTKIMVSPANTRDAWSCSLDTLMQIKLLSFKLRQICASLEYSAMGCEPEVALRRKKFLSQENSLYIMLDYKKCGLTVNRRLLSIIGETLYKQYQDEDFLLLKKFETCKVFDENEVRTRRGTGLGNCNEGITILQCILGHLFKKMFDCNSIFFNDDGVIQIPKNLVKRNLVRIITFVRSIGMVVNLKKTFLSHSNVFCEDYNINAGDFSYHKKQLLVLGFSSVFFQKTLYQAKRLFFSLDRSNRGHQINSDNLLNSLIGFYGYEFFESEYSIPYHIGGWRELSSSNYSLLLDWLYYPEKYALDSISRSQIGLAQSWAYEILLDLEQGGLLSEKSKISYRTKIKSTLERPFEIETTSEYSRIVYEMSGILQKDRLDQQFDDMINYRGLHNAKPKILLGLAMKEERRRSRLFKKRSNIPIKFLLSESSLSNVISLLKRLPDSPEHLAAPLPKGLTIDSDRGKGHVKVVTSKGEKELDRPSLNSTLASIEMKRWLPGGLIDLHKRVLTRKRSGYLISDRPIVNPGRFDLPGWMRLLYPSKRLARLEIATRLGGNVLDPIKFGQGEIWERTFKSPLVEIFGVEALEIESLLSSRKVRKEIVDFYQQIGIESLEQFRKSVQVVRLLISEEKPRKEELPEEEPPYLLSQFIEKLDDDLLFKDFFGEQYEYEDLEPILDNYDSEGYKIIIEDEGDSFESSSSDSSGSDEDSIRGDELRRLNRQEFDIED